MEYINKIIHGDCLEKLKELPENSVDSIVTDPPAGISFMGKSWDTDKGGRDNWIKWMQEVATECKRVLKPGGHAFVWAIPRTSHWTATAWENAGFEIRDVVAHIFGSGFPKSLNIGKAVDKLQGNERENLDERGGAIQKGSVVWSGNDRTEGKGSGFKERFTDTKGTSEWEGWGTALKPAREDWLLMRKPLAEKTVAENVLKYGTGGINIDGSRVGSEEIQSRGGIVSGANNFVGGENIKREPTMNVGRFPANLIHDNSEEVKECFPESKSPAKRQTNSWFPSGESNGVDGEAEGYGDSGNASRFFKSIIYQAKASKSERNKGCEGMDNNKPMYESHRPNYENTKGIETPFAGTGRTGNLNQNNHPTVKPIALMEYLIKMVTPTGGIVLDPFAGSGSTLVAAKQNGFNYIGIEMTEEYIPIINARLGL